MPDILHFEFMRHALLAGLLASVICGVMGSLVVVNRMVLLSGGIAHAAYGGIGLAFFLRWPYMLGTLLFSTAAALVMAMVSLKAKHRADAIIGVIWAVGMAIGIILLDLTPGYNVDLMSYLFGSILTVPRGDLWIMFALGLVMVSMVWFFYTDLLALSYDEEFARIRGVPVKALYLMLVVLLAVAVVLIIQVVGLILVIALLTIPPFIAEKFSRTLAQMMGWSVLLSMLFTMGGLFMAYRLNLSAGACIILVAGFSFFLSLAATYRAGGGAKDQPVHPHSAEAK